MQDLPRKLSLADLTAISVGNIIGAAIFLTPSIVARNLPSPEWILAAWTFAGLTSLAGALTCAELGAMYPSSGGQYVYLRESLGRFPAFLFGWTVFIAIRSGGLASLAVGFSLYLSYFVALPPAASKLFPVALLLGLAWINYRGVRAGAAVQNAFTLLKLAGLAAIILAGLTMAVEPRLEGAPAAAISWAGVGAALIPCLWSYQGWFSVPMVAGEAKDPGRALPLSLGVSVSAVLGIYLLANLAYLRVLPATEMAATARPASEVMTRTLGAAGAAFVSACILVSIVGAMNASVMAGPRVYFAQARDGLLPGAFAQVHTRYETPAFSIWTQAVWSSLLALSGSYEMLITYAGFTSWLFYGLTAVGLLRLRRRRPEAPRPYRVWGFPATPLLFALVSFAFVGSTLWTAPEPSLWGLALISSGAPLYWMSERLRTRRAKAASSGAAR